MMVEFALPNNCQRKLLGYLGLASSRRRRRRRSWWSPGSHCPVGTTKKKKRDLKCRMATKKLKGETQRRHCKEIKIVYFINSILANLVIDF